MFCFRSLTKKNLRMCRINLLRQHFRVLNKTKPCCPICMQSCRRFIMGNNRCVTVGLVQCLSVDKDRHVLGFYQLYFCQKRMRKTRDNHVYCPGRTCKAAKNVEATQEQPSKHNGFNHNFGEQALNQVRLKSYQATEALRS